MKEKEAVKEINGTKMILHQNRYMPVQNANSLGVLKATADCWDSKAKKKLAENGWTSGEYTKQNAKSDGQNHSDFEVGYTGNPMFASFIPGVAFIADSNFDAVIEEKAVMINTLDDGFHYVIPGSDRMGTEDLGPVTEPVIIGNSKRPYGLFVPFNNDHAMKSGTAFLAAMIDNKTSAIEGGNDNKDCKDCNVSACIDALNTIDNGGYTYDDVDADSKTSTSTLWG